MCSFNIDLMNFTSIRQSIVTVHRDSPSWQSIVTVHRDSPYDSPSWQSIVTVHRDSPSWQILIMKATRCTNFSNLFWKWNSTCFGQFLCTSWGVFHCTHGNMYMSYRFRDRSEQDPRRLQPDPARKLSTSLYDIYLLLCLQWKTPDDGQRNCPKQVEFHFQNKFEKLVHLVGFVIRIAWMV
jgi:hypothetical protein